MLHFCWNFLKEILSLQQSTELNLQLQHICIWRLWRYCHETFKCRSPFLNMDRCLTDKWPAPRLPLTLAVAGSNAYDLSLLHGFVTLQSQKSGLQYTRMHARTHTCTQTHTLTKPSRKNHRPRARGISASVKCSYSKTQPQLQIKAYT